MSAHGWLFRPGWQPAAEFHAIFVGKLIPLHGVDTILDAARLEPEIAFRVVGRGLERLIARHDLENEEALRYLEDRLRAIGVIRALEAEGFAPGDDVEIGGVEFELDPGTRLGLRSGSLGWSARPGAPHNLSP